MLHRKSECGPAALMPTREILPPSDPSRRAVEAQAREFAVADLRAFPISTTKTQSRRQAAPNGGDRRNDNLPGTLTRKAIAKAIVDRCGGISQQTANSLLGDVIKVIVATLAIGEDVSLHKFGSFIVRKKNARPGRNPRTEQSGRSQLARR